MRAPRHEREGPYDVEDAVAEFLDTVAGWSPDDRDETQRYVSLALSCHRGQVRRSGAPYVTHPLTVAALVAGVGESREAVWLALLHDLPDTATGAARLRDSCRPDVRRLVWALQALDPARLAHARTLTPDEHALAVVKGLDRLHDARTSAYVPAHLWVPKAFDTLRTLVPLTLREGLPEVARELDELARSSLGRTTPLPSSTARQALRMLPAADRARYDVEWAAELASLRTRRERLAFGLGVLWAAAVIRLSSRPSRRLPPRSDRGGTPVSSRLR